MTTHIQDYEDTNIIFRILYVSSYSCICVVIFLYVSRTFCGALDTRAICTADISFACSCLCVWVCVHMCERLCVCVCVCLSLFLFLYMWLIDTHSILVPVREIHNKQCVRMRSQHTIKHAHPPDYSSTNSQSITKPSFQQGEISPSLLVLAREVSPQLKNYQWRMQLEWYRDRRFSLMWYDWGFQVAPHARKACADMRRADSRADRERLMTKRALLICTLHKCLRPHSQPIVTLYRVWRHPSGEEKEKFSQKKFTKKKYSHKKKTFQVSCAFLQLQEFSQRNQTWEHHPSTFAARLFLRLHTTYWSRHRLTYSPIVLSHRLTYSPIVFTNFSSINLVSIFRCSSSTTNPVYARRVNSLVLVCSLSSHRHS